MQSVGVIGLGKMGAPMAGHLLKKGFQVFVYDIRPETMAALTEKGALSVLSPREVAARAEVTIVIVGYDREVQELMLGPDGLLEGARSGSAIVISSTVRPSTVQHLAAKAAERGVHLLDAPLCRGGRGVADGTAMAVVGGDAAVLQRCRPALSAFCSDIEHLGEVGAGQVGKTVNNLLLWACRVANHEAFGLSDAHGIDRERMRAMLLKSSGANACLEHNKPTFAWAHKDLAIALEMGDDADLTLPLTGLVREVIKDVKANARL